MWTYPEYPAHPEAAARMDWELWMNPPRFAALLNWLTAVLYTERQVSERPALALQTTKPGWTCGGDPGDGYPKILFAQTCSKDYGSPPPASLEEHLASTLGRYRTERRQHSDRSPRMGRGRRLLQGVLGLASPPDLEWDAVHRLGMDFIHFHAPAFQMNTLTPARAAVLRGGLARIDALLKSADLRLVVLNGAIYARVFCDHQRGIAPDRFTEVVRVPYCAATVRPRPVGTAVLGALQISRKMVPAVILTAMPQTTWPPLTPDQMFELGAALRQQACKTASRLTELDAPWPPRLN
jgi:hypothetical protein